jgi:phosphoenolpyruvate carboxykinase (ATP)
MQNHGPVHSRHGVDEQGLSGASNVYWNLPPARLYEEAVRRGEARISADGALICHTGEFTGRSPNDKFVVEDAESSAEIWWGKVNKPISGEAFDRLLAKVRHHLGGKDLFVFDGYAGADPRYRMPVRVITETAWQALFASNMFVRETDPEKLAHFEPGFVVLDAASFKADPAVDGTRTSTFILVNFAEKMVLIGGTEYAGEIKKSIFTVMNHVLPGKGIFPMHCSANYGADRDDVALFFGLSGTGKTTLSADPAGRSSATTSTPGRMTASSISRAAATPRWCGSRAKASPTSGRPRTASARSSRTSSSIPRRASSTSSRRASPRTPARATRSPTCATAIRRAPQAIPKTSSF